MPLVKQQLVASLTKALSPNQKNSSAKMQAFNIAKAYSDYAQNALSPAGGTVDPSTKAVKLQALATALEGVFKTQKVGTAVANGIGNAFSAFWLLPAPTVFIAVPPGAVTAAIPASLVTALISSASKKDSSKKSAEKLANNLHTWTTTQVIVTHLPVPPGPVGPIT